MLNRIMLIYSMHIAHTFRKPISAHILVYILKGIVEVVQKSTQASIFRNTVINVSATFTYNLRMPKVF